MIKQFPEFTDLNLQDKEEIESLTSKFPPYSDFNFVSLWSWDTRGAIRVSLLDSNLVVRFTDYLTNIPFYSFIGNREVNKTAKRLLDLSITEGLKPQLRLVLEDTAILINPNHYSKLEDRDSFDYLYSTENLINLVGSEYSNQRRLVRRFKESHPNAIIKELDLKSVEDRMQILKLNDRWRSNKELNFNNKNEEKAMIRLLNSSDFFNLSNYGVFIKSDLVAFTINEKINDEYAVSYFAKFDTQYRGSYLYSMQITSENMLRNNCKYINCEQDLGLVGLRSSKESLCPVRYLKKYTIEQKNMGIL